MTKLIDDPWLIAMFAIAVAGVISCWIERRAHNRELLDKRFRHFEGEL